MSRSLLSQPARAASRSSPRPQGAGAIGAVTLDLDDTLWAIWPVVERAEQRLEDWLLARYPAIPARFGKLELRALCGEIARDRPEVAHNHTVLRREALRLAAERSGCADFPVDAAFAVYYAARQEVTLFDDVLPALERLSNHYRLVALSNGNAHIGLIGLDHLFEFAINAIDVGTPKPHPAMFEAACQRLDLRPRQIVHVGDDPEHDVLGAGQVGMRTVWVNRDGREWPGGARPDAEIQSLEELAALLGKWDADDGSKDWSTSR